MKIEACLTDDIARTLLIPLWCCATPCRANPRATYDPVAVDVLKQLDFDFSEIRRSFKEYGQVCCLAREMNIDRTVRDFLARHPEGTIINLGCGLSTAVYRKPPAEAVWYDVDLPEVILTMILQHHERLDGSGYPNKLRGDEIVLQSRILAVADVVEAMTSHRPYRPALGIEAALKEIESGRGVKYDARVVDLCVSLFRDEGFLFSHDAEI